jgi:hypothetical protein
LRALIPPRTPWRAEPAASRQEEYAAEASSRRTDRSETEASSSAQRPRISASMPAAAARSADDRKRATRKLRAPGLISGRSGSRGCGAEASMAGRIPTSLGLDSGWSGDGGSEGKKTTGKTGTYFTNHGRSFDRVTVDAVVMQALTTWAAGHY